MATRKTNSTPKNSGSNLSSKARQAAAIAAKASAAGGATRTARPTAAASRKATSNTGRTTVPTTNNRAASNSASGASRTSPPTAATANSNRNITNNNATNNTRNNTNNRQNSVGVVAEAAGAVVGTAVVANQINRNQSRNNRNARIQQQNNGRQRNNQATSSNKASKRTSIFAVFLCAMLGIIIGFGGGFAGHFFITRPTDTDSKIVLSDELTIHFLELGNQFTGVSALIQVGDVDILVDAGSRANSAPRIIYYLNRYVTGGVLDFVIATHAHQDHIAAFPAIFDAFEVGILIDFPRTNSTTWTYNTYREARERLINRGTTHFTALEAYMEINGAQRIFELGIGIYLEILWNFYYENSTSNENNYSIAFMINQGYDRHFMFTGDMELSAERRMVEYYEMHHGGLPQVTVLQAGHHGSSTSTNMVLLEAIRPQYIVIPTVAGSPEFTATLLNQFPTQTFINRIAPFTRNVFATSVVVDSAERPHRATSMNGDVVVTSNRYGITINGSNNDTLLMDTDWFRAYRQMPVAWAAFA